MIAEYFKDITEIPGVEAVALFDNSHKPVDIWSIPKFNPGIFEEIGVTFFHIFSIIEKERYSIDEIVVPHERGLIYAKNHPKFFLIIIARLSVEISLIRITVNVCVMEFISHKKIQKLFKKLPSAKMEFFKPDMLDETENQILKNILEEYHEDGRTQ